MAQRERRISDLTIDEFLVLVRIAVRDALDEERTEQAIEGTLPPSGLLDLQPLSIGDWPPELKLISREEYYDDDR